MAGVEEIFDRRPNGTGGRIQNIVVASAMASPTSPNRRARRRCCRCGRSPRHEAIVRRADFCSPRGIRFLSERLRLCILRAAQAPHVWSSNVTCPVCNGRYSVMTNQKFERLARLCDFLAQNASTPEQRERLIGIAERWRAMSIGQGREPTPGAVHPAAVRSWLWATPAKPSKGIPG